MWRDPDKQWLPLPYKVTTEELDAIVQEWSTEWKNLVIQEEISEEQPLDAPKEFFQKYLSTHDSDNESSTDPEDAA